MKEELVERLLRHEDPTPELYQELSTAQAAALVERILESLRECDDDAETLLLELAAFTDANLQPIQSWLADGYKLGYPPLAFRGAAADARDRLLVIVEGYPDYRDQALLALGWIGDAAVVERFTEWRRHPPSWLPDLRFPLDDYAREAGWEPTPEGRRRDLFSTSCRPLVAKGDAIRIARRRDERCPWCGRALTELFEGVVTCHQCTGYGVVHGAGGGWHPRNEKPVYLPSKGEEWMPIPADTLRLSKETRPARWSASWFLPLKFSQLGGMPTWVQNAEYPACLDCGRTMTFTAQLDNSDLEDYSEGIYYAFACADCRTTATSYQQS